LFLTSPFFRRGIEGVVSQQIDPLYPPLKKGEARSRTIYGSVLNRKLLTSFLYVALSVLLFSHANAKNIDLSTLPARDSVQLTIYNSEDLTLVKESRQISIKKGTNRLQFSWANTQIDPSSVQLRFVSHPMQMTLNNTIFPHAKPQMLYWNIESATEALASVEISYFTSGISWQADYSAMLDAEGETMSMDNFVRITNYSGEDYENAQIRLVIGQINLVERVNELVGRAQSKKEKLSNKQMQRQRKDIRQQEARRMMAQPAGAYDMSDMAMASPVLEEEKKVEKEGLSEYTIFSVEGTETIPNQWSKRLRSAYAKAIKIQTVYRYRPREYGNYLAKVLIFKNDQASSLGESPLPQGKIQIYQKNKQGSLNYIAGLTLKYTSIGEKVELNTGVDPEVHFNLVNLKNWRDNIWMYYRKANVHRRIDDGRVIVDHRSTVSGWNDHSLYAQQLRNYTDKAIDIEIRRIIYGDAIIKSELEIKKHDFQSVDIYSKLGVGEKQELLYETEIKKGRSAKQNRLVLQKLQLSYPVW